MASHIPQISNGTSLLRQGVTGHFGLCFLPVQILLGYSCQNLCLLLQTNENVLAMHGCCQKGVENHVQGQDFSMLPLQRPYSLMPEHCCASNEATSGCTGNRLLDLLVGMMWCSASHACAAAGRKWTPHCRTTLLGRTASACSLAQPDTRSSGTLRLSTR